MNTYRGTPKKLSSILYDLEADKVYELKEYKENILISINDNGIGMSENTLSKIYEVFYTTKPQGTGLGLTFSKEVIELHQGTINIKSEKDKGTNIIIRLPK